MDYVVPAQVARAMVSVGSAKALLPPKDIMVRGVLSGALLGVATTLAFTANLQTQKPIVGALIFPVGFVMIVLLGLELVTGNFALVPLARIEGTATGSQVLNNLFWAFMANLLGSVGYAALLSLTLTGFHHQTAGGIAPLLVVAAETKTIGYANLGIAGFSTAFVKGILCNWLVCFGVVMGMTSSSTLSKIAAAWLPIVTFFAQGFEHSVVNMFVIPAGMMLGAKVSFAQWWLWNQIPVTLGNLVGGFLLTGLPLYYTYRSQAALKLVESEPIADKVAGEEALA